MGSSDHRRRPFWYIRRRRHTVASEVDEELNLHLQLRIEELQAGGVPADAARREALRQFGDLEGTRRDCRHQNEAKEQGMQRRLMIADAMQDLRIGLRGLLRAPLMTMAIVATVGLGIGATTAIFSAVYAALLRPLPYAEPDRLVRFYTDTPPFVFRFSLADYFALLDQQTHFVVGLPLRLDGSEYTLVGVLPPAVGPLERGQKFFTAAQWAAPPRRGPFLYTVLGRLRSDANQAAAASELREINWRIFPLWKASYQDDKATWSMTSLKDFIVGDVDTVAGLSLTAVGLVWLIACANASNLLIARVTSRRQELAVRAALGASRGRVVRYLLAESALLAIGAVSLGTMLAWIGMGLLRDVGSNYFPRMQEIAFDGPVLWLLIALTICSGLMFGLIPAWHGSGGPVGSRCERLDERQPATSLPAGYVGSWSAVSLLSPLRS